MVYGQSGGFESGAVMVESYRNACSSIMVNWLFPPTLRYGALIPTTLLSLILEYFSIMILIPAISLAQSSTVALLQKFSSSLCLRGRGLERNCEISLHHHIITGDLRDRMRCDFVSFPMGLLNGGVVGIFMTDEECRFNVATVRIFPLAVEHFLVKFDVVIINGVVECDCDHLRNVLREEIARDGGPVLGAEAVGQDADGRVARRGSIRIVIDIW